MKSILQAHQQCKTTAEEFEMISKIAKRAVEEVRLPGDQFSIMMDIEFTNAICPLRLKDLFEADKSNFSHDVCGIYQHFNRQTFELEGCFFPRFAK